MAAIHRTTCRIPYAPIARAALLGNVMSHASAICLTTSQLM
jgi:hypothetical protein